MKKEKQSLTNISDFDTTDLSQKGIKRIHDNEPSGNNKGTNNIKKSKSSSRIKFSEKIDNILNDSEKTFQESEPSLYSGHFMSFENQFCEFCEKTFPNMILFEEHKNNFHKSKTQIVQEIPEKSMQDDETFPESESNLQYEIDPSWYSGHFMSGLIFETPGGPISGNTVL